ncbi:MAG: NifB/NifX family molybdenum-iron cluster-binding protein [Kiritimatiellae bacterium]|nr:NifB/NifX family molybdenum-iron cluster-binding protein [Kiritimatiellia bacterium]
MRVALTTWNGRISPVFDVARQVELLEIDKGRVVGRRSAGLPGTDPLGQANALSALQPQVLICGAVSGSLAAMLTSAGMQLIAFTAGESGKVLDAWLAGALPNPAMTMPGCGGGRRGRCGGRGRGCRAGWRRGAAMPQMRDCSRMLEREET